MANRYWVASFAGTWNDTFNWSTTSGGFGGASVPGASDTAIFDGNGIGKCTLDMNVTVDYLDLTSGYTGAGADDGHFDSGGFDVTITSSSTVTFQNKTVTFDDGTPTTWTFGQGFSPRSSSASFTSMTACTWRFTGTGTVDSPSSKNSIHKILIENGANIRSDWGFYSRNFELRGRLRVSLNYPGVYIDGAGTSEVRITSTGVLECRTTHGGGFSCQSNNASSVLNLYVDGSFDDPGNNERFRNNSGFQFQAGTVNIYATVPIDCTYQMRTIDNVNGNVHKLQQNTTFNRLRVDHHWSRTITFDQNNYDVTFGGEVAFYEAGKPTAWIPGTGSVILAPSSSADINFDGKTIGPLFFSDTATGTATLQANVTTPYVHDCANQIDENGYTVTTTGTDPSPCSTGSRYWVGLVDSDYENSGNWSTSSGGLGNASVPVGTNDVVFDSGSSVNCTMSANRAAASFDVQSGYSGVFSDANFSVLIIGNVTLSGSNSSYGTSTWTVGGNWDFNGGSLSGTNVIFNSGSSTFESNSRAYGTITVNSGVTLTTQNLGGSVNCQILTVNGTYTSSQRFRVSKFVNTGASGEIGGTGTIEFINLLVSPHGIGTNSGLISINNLTFNQNGNYPVTQVSGSISSANVAVIYTGSGTTYLRPTSNVTFSGNFTLSKPSGSGTTIFDAATNNPSMTFGGDVALSQTTGTVSWSAGDGTIIFDNSGSQSINFNGQTVEGIHVTDASTGSIVLASDFSTAWLRDCDSLIDLSGYTITNADSVDRCVYPYDPPTTIALDSAAAINTGLEGWWHFLEGTGSAAADISTSANNLSHSFGEFDWNVTKIGTAGNLIGTGLLSTSTVPTLTDKLTISQWLYYEGNIERETSFAGHSGGSNYAWAFRTENSGDPMRFHVNGSYTQSSQLSLDQWVHIVGVYDGTDIRLYIDGVQDGTPTSVTGNVNSFTSIFIGNQNASSSVFPFTGLVQNSRIWSRALSSSEVSSLHSDPWIGSDYTAVVPPSNRFFSPAAFARLG